jgi:hypothetical protein
MKPMGELLAEYQETQEAIEILRRNLWDVERDIVAQMTEVGATEMRGTHNSNEYVAKLDTRVEYDKDRLNPLLEYDEIPADELSAARILAKTIPATWNMTKVKALAKYGGRVRRLIMDATLTTVPKLKVVHVGAVSDRTIESD